MKSSERLYICVFVQIMANVLAGTKDAKVHRQLIGVFVNCGCATDIMIAEITGTNNSAVSLVALPECQSTSAFDWRQNQ